MHFFQQPKIKQYLLYELFKVQQKATDLIRCKQRKTNMGIKMQIQNTHNQKIRNQNNIKVDESMKTNGV